MRRDGEKTKGMENEGGRDWREEGRRAERATEKMGGKRTTKAPLI